MKVMLHIPSATTVSIITLHFYGQDNIQFCRDHKRIFPLLTGFSKSSIYSTDSGMLSISNEPDRYHLEESSYLNPMPEHFTIIEVEE